MENGRRGMGAHYVRKLYKMGIKINSKWESKLTQNENQH